MALNEARLAEVSELADFIGEPIAEDVDKRRAELVLSFASMLVRKHARQPDWGKVGVDTPDEAVLVALSCASRGYLNPEGWANERVDDWGAGGRPVEELGMYLTGTEKATLADYRPSAPRIGTVSTFRDEPSGVGGLVATSPDNSTTPIPWW